MIHDINSRHVGGFTLIELIIAMAIAAILLGLAVPNFSDLAKDRRADSEMSCLNNSLYLARSEALKRSASVTVCARSDDSKCGTDWTNGSLVFTDSDSGSDTAMATVDASTDTVLRVCPALETENRFLVVGSSNRTASGASSRPHIRFEPNGRPNWENGYILNCDDRTADNWQAINVSLTGGLKQARLHSDGDALVNIFNLKLQSCPN